MESTVQFTFRAQSDSIDFVSESYQRFEQGAEGMYSLSAWHEDSYTYLLIQSHLKWLE